MSLFDTTDYTIIDEPDEPMSYGRRLTQRARLAIAGGKHPANGLPIDTAHTCGDCDNLNRYDHRSHRYLKCEFHRLGESRSQASDMRASWPACPHWKAAAVPELPGQLDMMQGTTQ